MPPEADDYRELLRMRMRRWAVHHKANIMGATTWMGVPMRKNPLDSWVYQEILHEVRPDVVVEIGSYAGGSTLYFAHLMDLLGKGTVVSIDPSRAHYVAQHDRILTVTGRSSDPQVQAQVATICADRTVLVCHDGDHRKDQVLRDLRDYADHVSVGSYFIVEDGILDLFPRGSPLHPAKFPEGPLPAIEEFLASDSRFEVDPERERFLATWNPKGYLRRVR
jgi:cephalosporin hydroxylase